MGGQHVVYSSQSTIQSSDHLEGVVDRSQRHPHGWNAMIHGLSTPAGTVYTCFFFYIHLSGHLIAICSMNIYIYL